MDAVNRECITDDEIARVLDTTAVMSDCLGTSMGQHVSDGYCEFVERPSYPKSLFRRWRFQLNVKSVFLLMTCASLIFTLLKRYGPPNPSDAPSVYWIFITAFAVPCVYIGKGVHRNRFVGMTVGAACGVVFSHATIVGLWICLIWS